MNQSHKTTMFWLTTALMFASFINTAAAGPKYSSAETKDIIEQMITAHGGMTTWRNASSFTFENIMYITPDAFPIKEGMSPWMVWDVSRETVDIKNRRAYKDILYDKGELIADGNKVWTHGLKNMSIDDNMPPGFRIWHHFAFINLPWLTQQSDVVLAEPGRGKLPGDSETEYITVNMTYKESKRHLEDEYLLLYIHPGTHLLIASEYKLFRSAFNDGLDLPVGAELKFPPMLRVNDEFVVVEGLTVPTRYSTTDQSGETLFGMHLILNMSFSEKFDESRMKAPSSGKLGMNK